MAPGLQVDRPDGYPAHQSCDKMASAMPLYEYLCVDCGHRFEFLQSIGVGAEGLSCPRCGDRKLEKQFSTFAGKSKTGAGGRGDNLSTGGCGAGSGFT